MPASPPVSAPSFFALADRHPAKAAPALVAADDAHLRAVADALTAQIADESSRLDAARRAPGGGGTEALERDQEVHRRAARLRTLQRYGVDLCLGRMVPDDGGAPVYIGRLGLGGLGGERLLVDWRSPAAEPFFGATRAQPMGLASRRRFRWSRGLVEDYWDEAFTDVGAADVAALDDESAFIAGLGTSRSSRMRDVLGTIAADQDAIIRAGSAGALVVDGGPGTGKTVVALHRAAYLRYADPMLGDRRGGVLVIGPHRPYLEYVSDVLPSLGEDGVQTATLRDLLPEGATAVPETDPEVAALKSTAAMVAAVETGVRWYEEVPTAPTTVVTEWDEVVVRAADWAESFAAVEPGTPHNDAREVLTQALTDVVVDRHDDEVPTELLRRALARNADLHGALDRAWPLLEPEDVVGDLWSVPAFLRMCAPWLEPEQVRTLQRPDPRAWTIEDLPLLDAARLRLGDPHASRRRRRVESELAAERQRMDDVVSDLIATDDSELMLMSMLRGDDLQAALADSGGLTTLDRDRLAGPFGHVVVDEAQELTDAQWQMVLARCPSRSLTVVGDRAQARAGFAESWEERLARVGAGRARVATLGINYRTPAEVMEQAAPVIRAALPDVNVPTSVRSTGVPVRHGRAADLDDVLDDWLASHAEGVACVIGGRAGGRDRVRALTPRTAKGLEFDLVVLVEPVTAADGVAGAVDRYVSMTRATQELVVLAG